jgi:hypothetical protein
LSATHAQEVKTIDRDELSTKLEHGDPFRLVMALNEWACRAKHIPRLSMRVSTAERRAIINTRIASTFPFLDFGDPVADPERAAELQPTHRPDPTCLADGGSAGSVCRPRPR